MDDPHPIGFRKQDLHVLHTFDIVLLNAIIQVGGDEFGSALPNGSKLGIHAGAVGTFEVVEVDDGDLCALSSADRSVGRRDCIAGVLGQVELFQPGEGVAVF